MIQRSNSSLNKGILCRPRLNALIRDGLEHPFLVMLAGPGYGKTQAMAGYLAESKARALWIRLTNLDNLPTHFWNHVVQAFKPEYPELSQSLRSLGFPGSLSSFAALIKILNTDYIEQKQLIMVFDDFGVINSEPIKNFFRMLVDMELNQFPLVLISSELTSTDSIAFMSSKRFLVLAKDLRFTREEIAELYHFHNLDLDADELIRIEEDTEGWALALRLLVQRGDKAPDARLTDEITITHMFEERFFSAYSEKQRLMLTRLGQLNHFSREMAMELYGGDPVELEELHNHPFYTPEPGTGRLFLHHLYHVFLQKKHYLLSEEDKRRTWKTAAEHYAASGDAMEALSCYRKSGDHSGMLKVISGFAKILRNITEKEAGVLLEHLDLLTPSEMNEHPGADYLRAHLLMNLLKLDQAETLLVGLEKRLTERGSPDETALLGDIYVALGFIHMMRNREDYVGFIQKAADYLPEGSSFYDRNTLAIENNNCFALADNQPGARERMEQAAFEAAPWIDKVLRGCMSGAEYIISAESAFMIGDFEKARQQAYRGICKAEANDQHDYVFNGYFVLSRVGFARGDLAAMTEPMRNAAGYAARHKIAVLEEIRDTLMTWYYMKLRDFGRIPKSITAMDFSKRPLTTYGRPQIAHASYLTAIREYAKVVAMLEHPRGLFLSAGIWHDRICLFLLLAVSHHHLGNEDAAMNAFWTAYDMCRHNNLTTIFIETGDYDSIAPAVYTDGDLEGQPVEEPWFVVKLGPGTGVYEAGQGWLAPLGRNEKPVFQYPGRIGFGQGGLWREHVYENGRIFSAPRGGLLKTEPDLSHEGTFIFHKKADIFSPLGLVGLDRRVIIPPKYEKLEYIPPAGAYLGAARAGLFSFLRLGRKPDYDLDPRKDYYHNTVFDLNGREISHFASHLAPTIERDGSVTYVSRGQEYQITVSGGRLG